MSRSMVVISDTQMPYEDKRALKAVVRFIGDYQPDEVVHIGDVLDLPQPSRWSKSTREEFEGSVFTDADYTVRNLIKPLREVYNGPVGFHEGNHDLRAREYLSKYAPALAESTEFHFENLLKFDAHNITRLPDFNRFAPGWVTTHGHLGGVRVNQIAGNTAMNAARRMAVSVVMGHTHRAAHLSQSFGYDNTIRQHLHGVEVGHLMDMRSASYLNKSAANWQQAFGLIRVDGNHVQAQPVSITHRKFIVEGETYKV